MNRLLKAWILGLGLLFVLVPSAMATKPGVYRIDNRKILDQVNDILITNGYCKYIAEYDEREKAFLQKDYAGYIPRRNDCGERDISFGVGSDNGIYAEFYQINNVDIINKIINIYTSAYFTHKQKINIDVNFYRQSHKEMMGFKKLYKNPYIKLTLIEVEK